MCNQLAWNILSLLVYSIVFAGIVYLPSERSFCCNSDVWRLLFLWLEALLLLICFLYVSFCLISNWRNRNSNRLKVSLDSKTLFEFIILSLFFLCTISNTSVLAGIDINDKDEFPMSLVPKLLIRTLRVVVAGLLTIWFMVYEMKYLPLEQKYAKCLQLRRWMHAFLAAMTLFQAVRFGIIVFFWPRVMTNILKKTDRDELYFTITLPVSNMFWLKCFFKLWESEPAGAPYQESTGAHINVGAEIAERIHATILKQMNIKLVFAVVTGLALVGIMYAIELLDKSNNVGTGCSYGLFRIGLSTIFIIMIIAMYVKKREGAIAVAKFHFHGVEMFQFVVFFLAKILINILSSVWFSSTDHLEGGCTVPGISVTAQVVDGVFNVLQFLCLLIISQRHWLLRSSAFYLLIAINCGLIWFDLSLEALHLNHYTDDYEHLNKQWVFLLIQAIFWMGIEFHIVVVELLIMQRLENSLKLNGFVQSHAPIRPQVPSKYYFHSVPPNMLSSKPNSDRQTIYSPIRPRSDSSTALLLE